MQSENDPWLGLPPEARAEAARRLDPGERLRAWFEPDLATELHFARSYVLLTDRQVLASGPAGPAGGHGAWTWQSWPLEQIEAIQARERHGLGRLELHGPHERLAQWRYTAARAREATRLADRFEALRAPGSDGSDGDGRTICPGCGTVLPADLAECPTCSAPPPVTRTGSAIWRLFQFGRPRLGMIALGFLLTLLSTAAGLIPPYLTQPLTDEVLIPRQSAVEAGGKASGEAFSQVAWYLGLMVAASLVGWLLSWARSYVMAWVSERIASDLRLQTYRHLMTLSVEYFGSKRTGDLITRVGSDTDRINQFLSVNAVDFATDCLMILGTAVILVLTSPQLALVTLIPLPLALWLVRWVRTHMLVAFDAGNRAWSHMTSVLADTIPGVRVVKAFAQERRETDRFAASDALVLCTNDRINRVWAFFGPMLALMTQLGLILVWVVGAWQVLDGQLTVGALTMFLTYLGRFYTRLESMSRMVEATQRAASSAQRVFEILDRTPSVPEPVQPIEPGRLRGAIELKDVNFRYGPRQVLFDIDLKIQPGEMIGLVGQTGAGKSTLINLICRFYDVSSGSIVVDGHDIRRYPVESYRRHIGLVLQEPFLFFGSIAENIAYGRPEASRAQILQAARAARAHDFIMRLPDGYDTPVGERGQSLSGGERQRISIARALLTDPAILILDEATSAVDTETEREIQKALENLVKGRTTLAIAHRLSTLRRADRIVVLDKGRIVEVGSHAELLERPDGAFARLHRAQQMLVTGQP